MSTWRNWLRTLLSKSDKGEPQASAPAPDSSIPVPSPAPILNTGDDGIAPQELYPLAPLKHWAGVHISPYAWDRAVIRSLSSLQQSGIPLPHILAPKPDTKVSGATLRILINTLYEMYGMKPDIKYILKMQEI